MSSGCAHPVDHCMCAHRVDHWMCAPSGPLDVCICITTTCKHPRAHRKRYIRWSTRCSYIWWTTSSPLVVIRMQRHLVDHRMWRSPVYADALYLCRVNSPEKAHSYLHGRRAVNHALNYLHGGCRAGKSCIWLFARQIKFAAPGKRYTLWKKKKKCFPPSQRSK